MISPFALTSGKAARYLRGQVKSGADFAGQSQWRVDGPVCCFRMKRPGPRASTPEVERLWQEPPVFQNHPRAAFLTISLSSVFKFTNSNVTNSNVTNSNVTNSNVTNSNLTISKLDLSNLTVSNLIASNLMVLNSYKASNPIASNPFASNLTVLNPFASNPSGLKPYCSCRLGSDGPQASQEMASLILSSCPALFKVRVRGKRSHSYRVILTNRSISF